MQPQTNLNSAYDSETRTLRADLSDERLLAISDDHIMPYFRLCLIALYEKGTCFRHWDACLTKEEEEIALRGNYWDYINYLEKSRFDTAAYASVPPDYSEPSGLDPITMAFDSCPWPMPPVVSSSHISSKSRRFLLSGAILAAGLSISNKEWIDWSGPIICYCKALEHELVREIIEPFRHKIASSGIHLESDLQDKDFRAVARYFSGQTDTPPEIGTFAYFLMTSISSKRRIKTSVLLRYFRGFLEQFQAADWLISEWGLVDELRRISSMRNPAAHIDARGRRDFDACDHAVLGDRKDFGTLPRIAYGLQGRTFSHSEIPLFFPSPTP